MDYGQGVGSHICSKWPARHLESGILKSFVQAVYRSLLHLSWIDKLVDNIKTLFVDLYGDQLRKPNTSIVECHFDEYFDQQLRELEGSSAPRETGLAEPINFSEPGLSDEPPPLPALLSRGESCPHRLPYLIC